MFNENQHAIGGSTVETVISFERNLYRAVIRYKREHPGALEDRTKQRKERNAETKAPADAATSSGQKGRHS